MRVQKATLGTRLSPQSHLEKHMTYSTIEIFIWKASKEVIFIDCMMFYLDNYRASPQLATITATHRTGIQPVRYCGSPKYIVTIQVLHDFISNTLCIYHQHGRFNG